MYFLYSKYIWINIYFSIFVFCVCVCVCVCLTCFYNNILRHNYNHFYLHFSVLHRNSYALKCLSLKKMRSAAKISLVGNNSQQLLIKLELISSHPVQTFDHYKRKVYKNVYKLTHNINNYSNLFSAATQVDLTFDDIVRPLFENTKNDFLVSAVIHHSACATFISLHEIAVQGIGSINFSLIWCITTSKSMYTH